MRVEPPSPRSDSQASRGPLQINYFCNFSVIQSWFVWATHIHDNIEMDFWPARNLLQHASSTQCQPQLFGGFILSRCDAVGVIYLCDELPCLLMSGSTKLKVMTNPPANFQSLNPLTLGVRSRTISFWGGHVVGYSTSTFLLSNSTLICILHLF